MMPKEIQSVGITFNADHKTVALYLFAAVISYFLCAFLCYSILDYVAAWEARDADRQNQLNEKTKAGYLTLPHPRTPPGLILTRRVRALLDFWLPIALGVGAIVEVIARTRHL